jgi:hypothetical protein
LDRRVDFGEARPVVVALLEGLARAERFAPRAARAMQSVLPPLLWGVSAALLVVGWGGIDPRRVGWCCGGDCATHQLGWSFFRVSDWSFPVGLNPSYGLEIASSVFYSDSIPLAAILFKLVAAQLPEQFQYLGLWTAASFVLQAWFAWRLLASVAGSAPPWVRWCALGLFTFAPAMMIRIGGHTALTSHWLVLAALSLYFGPPLPRLVAWPVLALVASLVHSYLFVMVVAIWLAHVGRRGLARAASLRGLLLEGALTLGCCGLGLWQGGFFAVSVEPSGGFGKLAMNLLAPFHPDLYSYVLHPIASVARGFNEGFNYLGLGCLLLLPVAVVGLVRRPQLLRSGKQEWPLAILLLALTLFAVSNQIALGSWRIEVPLPPWLLAGANVLRSSGRMFWPVLYTLILVTVSVIVRGHGPRLAAGLLLGASLIQAVDTSARWRGHHDGFAGGPRECPTSLTSSFWEASAPHYRRLRRVPSANMADDWAIFARFAVAHHMATDSVYLARVDSRKFVAAEASEEASIESGQFDSDTLYVLDEAHARIAAGSLKPDRDLLVRLDGHYVLAPCGTALGLDAHAPKSLLPGDFLTPLPLDDEVGFGAGGTGLSYLEAGWSQPEPWGVWADHRIAKLSLPFSADARGLRLDLELGALVAPNHPQRVEYRIGGEHAGTLEFSVENNTGWRKLEIPAAAERKALEAKRLQIVFEMLNPQSPKSLGLNGDVRELGMTLHRARFARP